MGSERVGNEPQVGMERFRRLVVERVKEVDSVLVDLVREVAKETLVDEVLHLLLGHLLGHHSRNIHSFKPDKLWSLPKCGQVNSQYNLNELYPIYSIALRTHYLIMFHIKNVKNTLN